MIHRFATALLLAVTAAFLFSGSATARTRHATGPHTPFHSNSVHTHSVRSYGVHTGERRAYASRHSGRRFASLRQHSSARSHHVGRAFVDRNGNGNGNGSGAAATAQSFVQRSGGGSDVVSEARRWIGTNPTGRSRLWCARFMNFVLARSGHRGTGSDMARSFASLGHRVSGPQVGAIAVMARRGGGHVGVVSGLDARGNPIVISGNHGHRVAESVYARGRIMAYVMP